MRARGVAILALAGMWMGWGLYFVAPDEQAVVRVLGRANQLPAGPGLHWNWPPPVGRVDKLKVREAKRLTLGFRAPDRVLGRDSSPTEARWLTGDRNVVHIRVVMQYAIHEPLHYLLRFSAVEDLLRGGARSALLEVVAGMGVDELLTTGKVAVQQSVHSASQEIFDRFQTGVSVLSVSLEAVTPPGEVRGAFNDVASAREDRNRLVREAESYRNEVVPLARGEAQTLL
ncbi:MAG: protease modulator HflK, partial [Acidobacteriota bacterium]|nr:protease modulator HflK [Acidobacteriota bacterium]